MKKYSMETVVGIFVVIGLICVGYMTIKLGKLTFLGNDTYTLYADFTSASGLRVGSPVEIYGIEVGRIEDLTIDSDKQMALVEVRIKNGIKVYEDATATIKTAGLIGDKFVKIDPGGSGELLSSGGRIVDTSTPPDIEELIGKYAFGDVKKDSEPKK
ncbi:MAG: putative phospholipid ABC transporter-binding protein MlaD [Syntrophorhabdus sp. PtaU1.Bin153]|jgi:phospholipid/cholesterol/gamma-HCH transport system substrate-binding protein|nr:MAG: putative phospholipid ABC transporter-binding protein MlaD [Syntrophorhabdus sp. PtaU1.Bin153]